MLSGLAEDQAWLLAVLVMRKAFANPESAMTKHYSIFVDRIFLLKRRVEKLIWNID